MTSDAAEPQPFKNRKAGLVVFGILTILGGCVSLLFALLAAVVPVLATRSPNPPPIQPNPWPGVTMYTSMAVALIWLGAGSIKRLRWSRALLAVLSWSFFVFGI